MNRRTVLTTTGVTLSTAFAGCLGESEGTGGENGSRTEDEQNGEGGETENNSDDNKKKVVEEDIRATKPSHDIERPDPPEGPEDYDEWNNDYLGEHIETEPSLTFDTVPVTVGWSRGTGLRGTDNSDNEAYQVRVVDNKDDYEAVFNDDQMDTDARSRLNAVDFDESALVIVESGFGSGSVEHRWARVEADEDVVHLHGYYTSPYEQTDDLTTRVSVLEIELPSNGLDFARVSLTVWEDRQVHFNSTEGVVTLTE